MVVFEGFVLLDLVGLVIKKGGFYKANKIRYVLN